VRGQKIHTLKTWPPYFQDIWEGRKTAEVRKNDRDFAVGDVLILNEWNPEENEYTGSCLRVLVTHMLRSTDGDFGLKRGYVMLSFTIKRRGETWVKDSRQ